MASYLILLGTPRDLHIPYFAMGAPRSRENSATPIDITDVTKLAGRQCAAWIKAQKDQGKIRLVETRNYVPHQTAFSLDGCCSRTRRPQPSSWKLSRVTAWMRD